MTLGASCPGGGRLYGHGGYSPSMRITRAWRVAPAWVRELIDEMDGVKKVGCYWVNRVSGMGIRSLLPLIMLIAF